MDCEKYKTSKIMYNENISWIYYIIGKYCWVLRVGFYFIRPKRTRRKTEGVYPRARLFGLVSARTRPSYCMHLQAAGQQLTVVGAVARQHAHGWQPCAEIQESRHIAGSHVWVTRFSIVHAHQNPSTRIIGTPAPGLGAATPGRVILTLRAPAAARPARGRPFQNPSIFYTAVRRDMGDTPYVAPTVLIVRAVIYI
jgi:hypothetical protein